MRLRRLDPMADAPLLLDWVRQDYAAFWGMQDCSLEQVQKKYRDVTARPGHQALLGWIDGQPGPACLLETYEPLRDRLASYFRDARASDRGFHLLTAPPRADSPRCASRGYYLLTAALEFLLREPQVQRIIAEPDIRNTKMLVLCQQVGFELGPVVHLPHKTAQMILLDRERFAALPRVPPAKRPSPVPPGRLRRQVFVGKVLRKLHLLR